MAVETRLLKTGAMPTTSATPDVAAVASVDPGFATVTVTVELPPKVKPDTVTVSAARETVAPLVAERV